jgi:hypothetical protein
MDREEARRLFFAYDGSTFYMSRDGLEEEYRGARVPPEVESAWLEELTDMKLRDLHRSGNWRVLHFLNQHANHGHLATLLGAEAKGLLWERCAFLEELLLYARACGKAGCEPSLVGQAVRRVVVESDRLLDRARSKASTDRIQAILVQARQTLNRP